MMKVKIMGSRKLVFFGVTHGVAAWLTYAFLGEIVVSLVPFVTQHETIFSPWHGRLSGLLFAVYILIGAVGGAIVGWALPASTTDDAVAGDARIGSLLQIGATLTLVAAFFANTVVVAAKQAARGPDWLSMAACILLLALGVLAIRKAAWRRRADMVNPMAASLLLLAAPWSSRVLLSGRSSSGKLLGSCGLVLGIGVVTIIVGRFLRHWGAGSCRLVPVRQLCVAAAGIMAIAAYGTVFNRTLSLTALASRPPHASDAIAGLPNVVLITMDTVRADHLSLYGYSRKTTPNLEKLSEEAVLYRHSMAAADMTLPGHASMFTGLYPSWHGAHYDPPAYGGGRPLSIKFDTLPKLLAAKGYLTMAVVANFAFLQPMFGLAEGFQVYDWRIPIPVIPTDHHYLLRNGVRALIELVLPTEEFDRVTRGADEITRETTTLLENVQRRGDRFFLFVNYMDAHTPYVPPAPYDTMFPGKSSGLYYDDYVRLQHQVARGERMLSEGERAHFISQYDGGIRFIDDQIGRLVVRLKDLGLYDNTLLIITSDHGEAFGEGGLMEHAVGSVHQHQVFVPLLIKYPHSKVHQAVDEPVSQVDIMPTILDVLNLPPPQAVQGRSLRAGDLAAPRFLISESFPPGLLITPKLNYTARAIVSGPMKFIASTAGHRELYDLSKDPGEQRNLYRTEDPNVKVLRTSLTNWVNAIPRQIGPVKAIDKDALRRLKSLGYAQ